MGVRQGEGQGGWELGSEGGTGRMGVRQGGRLASRGVSEEDILICSG